MIIDARDRFRKKGISKYLASFRERLKLKKDLTQVRCERNRTLEKLKNKIQDKESRVLLNKVVYLYLLEIEQLKKPKS